MADGAVDGAVIIDSTLSTTGFKAGSKELQSAIKSLNSKVESLGTSLTKALSGGSSSVAKFNGSAEELKNKIADIENKMSEFGNKKIPTEDYAFLKSKIEETEKSLVRLQEKEEKMSALGVKEDSSAWKSLQYDIGKAKEELFAYEDEKFNMEQGGWAYQDAPDTAEYQQLQSQLDYVRQKYAEVTEAAEENSAQLNQNQATADETESRFKRFASTLGGAVLGSLQKFGKTAANAATNGLKKLGANALKTIFPFSNVKQTVGGAEKSIAALGKKITGLWSMLKRMAIRKALSSVIQGAKEGFQNLAQYYGAFNNDMSALSSGLGQLKNSFAAAFAPILSIVAPILLQLISLLTTAAEKVGMFFAALGGSSTFVRATKVQKNYAGSLNDTAKASKKAYGAALDLDERHDIKNKDDGSGGGGGGAGGSGGGFETVTIDSKIKEFVAQIKDAFNSGDFEKVGDLIGQKINSVFRRINKAVSWNTVGDKITKTVTGFTRILNSLVDAVDWNLIGDTFAQGFNTIVNTVDLLADGINWQNLGAKIATGVNGLFKGIDLKKLGKTAGDIINIPIEFLYGAVETIKWSDIGLKLSDGVNSLFSTINWEKAGKTLGDGIKGVLDAITTGIQNINWQEIGNDIADFVGSINWNGVIDSLVAGLGAAIGGLATLIWGLIEDSWNDVVDWWKETAYEDGEFTIEGLLDGIVEKLKNIGKWIVDHIFKPFINGFEKAFKIGSPSRVMKDEGGFIGSGLINGLKAKIPSLVNVISSIKSKFSTLSKLKTSALTWGKDVCSNLANGIRNGISKVGSAVTKVAEKIKSIIGFSEPEDGPLSNFHTYMPDMLQLMADGINKNKGIALDAVSGVAQSIKERLNNGSYSIGFNFENETDSVLGDFTDKFVDEFSELFQRLQAIANNVSFVVPQAATNITPYTANDDSRNPEAFADKVFELVLELLKGIKFGDNDNDPSKWTIEGDVIIDGDKAGRVLAKPVVKEINRGKLKITT